MAHQEAPQEMALNAALNAAHSPQPVLRQRVRSILSGSRTVAALFTCLLLQLLSTSSPQWQQQQQHILEHRQHLADVSNLGTIMRASNGVQRIGCPLGSCGIIIAALAAPKSGGGVKKFPPRGPVGPTKRPADSCDYSKGNWVYDPAGPRYTADCPFIPTEYNCAANGRTDFLYSSMRWNTSCTFTKFNALTFLNMVRGRVMYFAGDIHSNTFLYTSLRCQLAKVITTQDWVGLIQLKNTTGFRVPAYNFYAIYSRVPFLTMAQAADLTKTSVLGPWYVPYDWISDRLIRLTNKANIVVFSSGFWWTYPNRLWYKSGKLDDDAQPVTAYFNMIRSLDKFFETKTLFTNWKGVPFFMGFVPYHNPEAFEAPDTKCSYFTAPLTEEEEEFAEGFNNLTQWDVAAQSAVLRGTNLRFVDVYRMSNFRPEAHVGKYGFAGNKVDCLNWCLPGVPDSWLDLFYTQLLKEKSGSY